MKFNSELKTLTLVLFVSLFVSSAASATSQFTSDVPDTQPVNEDFTISGEVSTEYSWEYDLESIMIQSSAEGSSTWFVEEENDVDCFGSSCTISSDTISHDTAEDVEYRIVAFNNDGAIVPLSPATETVEFVEGAKTKSVELSNIRSTDTSIEKGESTKFKVDLRPNQDISYLEVDFIVDGVTLATKQKWNLPGDSDTTVTTDSLDWSSLENQLEAGQEYDLKVKAYNHDIDTSKTESNAFTLVKAEKFEISDYGPSGDVSSPVRLFVDLNKNPSTGWCKWEEGDSVGRYTSDLMAKPDPSEPEWRDNVDFSGGSKTVSFQCFDHDGAITGEKTTSFNVAEQQKVEITDLQSTDTYIRKGETTEFKTDLSVKEDISYLEIDFYVDGKEVATNQRYSLSSGEKITVSNSRSWNDLQREFSTDQNHDLEVRLNNKDIDISKTKTDAFYLKSKREVEGLEVSNLRSTDTYIRESESTKFKADFTANEDIGYLEANFFVDGKKVGETQIFNLEKGDTKTAAISKSWEDLRSDFDTGQYHDLRVEAGNYKQDVSLDENNAFYLAERDKEPSPDARFSISDRTPEVDQRVDFDASDSEGDIEKYHWDFGDGDTFTDDDPKVSHRYSSKGDYSVELTVEEYDGDRDSTTRTVFVSKDKEENSAPKVDLRRPSDGQKIQLPYSLRWDAFDPDSDYVESTVFIAKDRYDESKVDDNYIIRENVGGSESFRLRESDLAKGGYMWRVKVTDEHGKTTWSNVRRFKVVSEKEKTGNAFLDVLVKDEDGDPLEDARVVVDNENWFSVLTDRNGEASFVVQPGTIDVTVSKDGYKPQSRELSISAKETRQISFTLEERFEEPEKARLDVHVEDDDYDELKDAKVTVEDGDREIRYTDSNGDARFYLESDNYDIEVECNGEKESRHVYLSEGERESIDIRFDEEFDSDICGEEEEDRDDRDEDVEEKGIAITDVDYPNSVCRGGSFRADMRVENRGGFHELVTITGSGLGSINTGQSFSLDVAETKSASIRFTDVEGSGTEEFNIIATNHDSDRVTERINVRDCDAQIPEDDREAVTGITAEVTPKETVVGDTVKVKGYVDGVRGRSEVTIRANSEKKATVSTQPDGYYVAYIRLDQIGENIIKVSSGQAETQSVVRAIPTSTLTGVSAPEKVFEGESYEVCTTVDSQIEPKVFLLRDGKVVDSKLANGEVCFEKTASKIGEHEFRIKALTYGRESSSPTTTTEILEVDSEVTNFPDKVATTESEEGMVKVELYNTHNDLRRYNVKLNGIQSTWLSQSEKEVVLNKGEKDTVYFYLTPEEEGTFEPTVTVVSKDATIYSEKINVYAGGTKNLRKTSLFDRLSQLFGL